MIANSSCTLKQLQCLLGQLNYTTDNRRCRFRMGSLIEWHPSFRNLDQGTREMALEQKRDVCPLQSPVTPSARITGCSSSSANGQQNVSCLHTERGWNQITGTLQPDIPSAQVDTQLPDNPISSLHSGKIQRDCGPTLTTESATRMAPPARGNFRNFQKIGRSGYRPFRFSSFCSSQSLRLQRLERSLRTLRRHLQSPLELQTRMAVSSPKPHSSGLVALEQEQGSISARGSRMEQDILDARSDQQEQRTSDSHSTPGQGINRPYQETYHLQKFIDCPYKCGRLGVGRFSRYMVQSWKRFGKKLLEKFDPRNIQSSIQRWITWCNENEIDPKDPKIPDLAYFLANLFINHNFAYSTILVHKSAIVTFCSGKSSTNLSSDFLVRQVLKGISTTKPKELRVKIWDANILLDWLSKPLKDLSFLEISRRTVALLLLASGRRIHDLTLLKISKNFITNLRDQIILWTAFGSKTD